MIRIVYGICETEVNLKELKRKLNKKFVKVNKQFRTEFTDERQQVPGPQDNPLKEGW